jgi:mono/diheme cytochrome c family protein
VIRPNEFVICHLSFYWPLAIGYLPSMSLLSRAILPCLGLFALGFMSAHASRSTPPGNSERRTHSRLFDQGDQPDGQKLFQTRCFVCHGRNGKGDGPSSTGLAEKPQDLTDPNWQKAIADDRIRSVIQGGGVAIGKSDAMPPNPDLTQDQIEGLVAYVRTLAGH